MNEGLKMKLDMNVRNCDVFIDIANKLSVGIKDAVEAECDRRTYQILNSVLIEILKEIRNCSNSIKLDLETYKEE